MTVQRSKPTHRSFTHSYKPHPLVLTSLQHTCPNTIGCAASTGTRKEHEAQVKTMQHTQSHTYTHNTHNHTQSHTYTVTQTTGPAFPRHSPLTHMTVTTPPQPLSASRSTADNRHWEMTSNKSSGSCSQRRSQHWELQAQTHHTRERRNPTIKPPAAYHVWSIQRLAHSIQIGGARAADNKVFCEHWRADEIHARHPRLVVRTLQPGNHGLYKPRRETGHKHEHNRRRATTRHHHASSPWQRQWHVLDEGSRVAAVGRHVNDSRHTHRRSYNIVDNSWVKVLGLMSRPSVSLYKFSLNCSSAELQTEHTDRRQVQGQAQQRSAAVPMTTNDPPNGSANACAPLLLAGRYTWKHLPTRWWHVQALHIRAKASQTHEQLVVHLEDLLEFRGHGLGLVSKPRVAAGFTSQQQHVPTRPHSSSNHTYHPRHPNGVAWRPRLAVSTTRDPAGV